GATFAALGTTSCKGYSSLVLDPTVAARMYVGVTGCQSFGTGVFRTDDDGLNWIDVTTVGEPEFVTGLLLEPRDPAVLYAFTEGGVFTRDLSQVPVELQTFTIE
ncbi:MAG: hypothetical protein DRJ61_16455, partial [Acidobacteria bacterium]